MSNQLSAVPLWRQLQLTAAVLSSVRSGRSMTAALDTVDAQLRPGVQALGFHAMRWLGRAEALRSQLIRRAPPADADALLCVALALMAAEPPASSVSSPYTDFTLVDQAVEAAKRHGATRHQASFINGCLRRYVREREALTAVACKSPQALWNHPAWWIDRLRRDWPDQWQAILRANNDRAPLTLRINQRQTSAAQYLRALSAIDLGATPVGAQGLVLEQPRSVPSLPGFDAGEFSVQDAAAQLAAPLLVNSLQGSAERSRRPRILDACAAPGGKTAHLLELAECELTAIDIDASRCLRIGQNLSRLGLVARVLAADAAEPSDWWDGQPFDGILLDAPCTASGIVRRHPDVRWLRQPRDIATLAAVQAKLLQALWPLLRPGGKLLYCTCSVFKAEGEDQIQTFLVRHKDSRLMPSPGHLLPRSSGDGPVFPDNLRGEHDGFYYALLEKKGA